MQIARIVQAAILMLVVALAASCAASKEYTSKIFGPRPAVAEKDSAQVAIRFLELDSLEKKNEDWVETKITKDSITNNSGTPIIVETKTPPVDDEPIAKTKPDGERTKTKRD
jgi:hypothetical protein